MDWSGWLGAKTRKEKPSHCFIIILWSLFVEPCWTPTCPTGFQSDVQMSDLHIHQMFKHGGTDVLWIELLLWIPQLKEYLDVHVFWGKGTIDWKELPQENMVAQHFPSNSIWVSNNWGWKLPWEAHWGSSSQSHIGELSWSWRPVKQLPGSRPPRRRASL